MNRESKLASWVVASFIAATVLTAVTLIGGSWQSAEPNESENPPDYVTARIKDAKDERHLVLSITIAVNASVNIDGPVSVAGNLLEGGEKVLSAKYTSVEKWDGRKRTEVDFGRLSFVEPTDIFEIDAESQDFGLLVMNGFRDCDALRIGIELRMGSQKLVEYEELDLKPLTRKERP